MRRLIGIFTLGLLALGGLALALQHHHGHPWPHHPEQGPMPAYDLSRETTRSGVVADVVRVADCQGCGAGIHLLLEGQSEEIHVGPASFVDGHDWHFAKGDSIEILGCEASWGDVNVFLAREIRSGDRKLVLRDSKGFPKWSGRRGPT
jgi:hypothetical protein